MSDTFEEIVTNWRLMVPIILTAAGLILAIKFGIEYSLLTWSHITTEDAQVKATKVQGSPEVSGRLRALYVDEGAEVRRGVFAPLAAASCGCRHGDSYRGDHHGTVHPFLCPTHGTPGSHW